MGLSRVREFEDAEWSQNPTLQRDRRTAAYSDIFLGSEKGWRPAPYHKKQLC